MDYSAKRDDQLRVLGHELPYPFMIFLVDGTMVEANAAWQNMEVAAGSSLFETRAHVLKMAAKAFPLVKPDDDLLFLDLPHGIRDALDDRYNTMGISTLTDHEGKKRYSAALMNKARTVKDHEYTETWETLRLISREKHLFRIYQIKIYDDAETGRRMFYANENFLNDMRHRETHIIHCPLDQLEDGILIYNHEECVTFLSSLVDTVKRDSMIIKVKSITGYDKYYELIGRGHTNSPNGVVFTGLSIDVTERLVFQETMANAARLNQAQISLSGLSQELNNMLTSVQSTIDFFDPDAAMSKEDIIAEYSHLRNELERGRKISSSLSTMMRLNTQSHLQEKFEQDQLSGVYLSEALFTGIAKLIDAIMPDGEVRLNISTDPNLYVPISEQKMIGIILSMASNGIQAIVDLQEIDGSLTPSLELKVELHDELKLDIQDTLSHRRSPGVKYLAISMIDNGIGMHSDVARDAMQPFFSTRKGTHIGLGLTTINTLAKSMQGGIHIKSRPQKGTEVIFWIPLEKYENP